MGGPDITYYREIIFIYPYYMALIFNSEYLCINSVVASGRMEKFQGPDFARGPQLGGSWFILVLGFQGNYCIERRKICTKSPNQLFFKSKNKILNDHFIYHIKQFQVFCIRSHILISRENERGKLITSPSLKKTYDYDPALKS